ncbi:MULTISPECIES: alkane oxidation protein activator PraB [Paraburkholderia]|uniref:alkane oxidation protein activator PraB n=1 Tax=Paraburkholderia TaxID=1822464 RepID=UPI002252D220|nr:MULTISPECIES: alkane oxidation protein activator PraB [Paraburkholderia]MCX4161868.1 hypothetical protein [Paraburkholderia megapolitana]MDN7157365.1 hypothetical protein [Paraburkholderia sp. CHISQ3]MDQ6494410.1 hypothetical protein [Paraburkholderia megapolitana]
MKSVKMRVFGGAVVAMCAAFSAATFAATIAPAGVSFSAPGTIVFSTPNFANVSCGISMSGVVASDGSYAQINSVAVTGAGLCGLPQVLGLPWKVVASSPTTVSITNVGFSFQLSVFGECGPSTINGGWNNTTNTLFARNQPLATSNPSSTGQCELNALSVNPSPALTVSP